MLGLGMTRKNVCKINQGSKLICRRSTTLNVTIDVYIIKKMFMNKYKIVNVDSLLYKTINAIF